MSWFTGSALGAGLGDTLSSLSSLKDQVKHSVEKNIDPNLIKNLTLMSDQLVSERKQLEEEELRKERVRDSLAEILPWQTRDSEMEILVDECKDAILKLSHKQETFTSPFVLTGGLPSEDDGGNEETVDKDEKAARDLLAAEVSAEKLAKLQPLPTLLGTDFDLDTHVGLVQRLLKEDENLVEMHSRLSSGGAREAVFWRNYFFHCAYARYEAGLSIDEIWSAENKRPSIPVDAEEGTAADIVQVVQHEEVVFVPALSAKAPEGSSITQEPATTTPAQIKESLPDAVIPSPHQPSSSGAAPTPSQPDTSVSTSSSDYEFVSGGGADVDDASMDELEAEIAAALDD
mmetsp:Transcript_22154/g.50301  ORF Transcript_22154/g.50301 Transcript_22154/m.50301 type:complete len:345 (+) Transcript_22154:177-1211(+)